MPANQKVTRKLTAIMSADIKGYSILMADDEVFTIKMLNEYRSIMSNCIGQYNGRVVDSPGDNVLAEFASAVDALQCAVEIQKKLKKENDRLVQSKRLEFRIGVNIGDVILDGNRIYGDGVNVASRIEGLAEPGGVCLSKSAYEQIKKKLDFGFEYMGEHPVKNISEPVSVYKVLVDSERSQPLVEEQLELPDKPSIAVLPFVNMSGDPEQEYFSDGITEDIITNLSKVSGLFVISRNSSFLYKGKTVKIQDVARDLGVRYVLEGSVRRGSDRIRITAQLIDGKTDHHVWADSYDRELKDIFAIQDEVTQKVVSELAVTLKASESERMARKHTENFEAYDMYLRALREVDSLKKEGHLKGIELCERVIELDSKFAGGYAWLSFFYSRGLRFGFSTSPREDLEKAFELAQKAVSIDETFGPAYTALASAYLMKGQHDDAVAAAMAGVSIQPGDSSAHSFLGFYLNWAGRGEEAIRVIKEARQLDPKYIDGRATAPFDFMGYATFTAGRYEESIAAWKQSLDRFGQAVPRLAFLTASYSELGMDEEAKAMAKQLLKIDPKFTLKSWKFARTYKNPEDTERLLKALRKAGLPE
jgi:adenylate cyclase